MSHRRSLACPPHLASLVRLHVADATGGVVRHALKNKLGALRNAAFLLRRQLEPLAPAERKDRVKQLFDLVDGEVKQANELLEVLRALPHEVNQPAPVEPAEVARRLVASLSLPSDVAVVPPAPSPLQAHVATGDLEVALHMLLENAVAACKATVEVAVSAMEERVAVHVTDDGPGFGEAAARALEPFYSSRGSFGVGLKVAQRVASRWGGDLELRDLPGGGARVSLLLRSAGGPS